MTQASAFSHTSIMVIEVETVSLSTTKIHYDEDTFSLSFGIIYLFFFTNEGHKYRFEQEKENMYDVRIHVYMFSSICIH